MRYYVYHPHKRHLKKGETDSFDTHYKCLRFQHALRLARKYNVKVQYHR